MTCIPGHLIFILSGIGSFHIMRELRRLDPPGERRFLFNMIVALMTNLLIQGFLVWPFAC
jgi:hypothetical protein